MQQLPTAVQGRAGTSPPIREYLHQAAKAGRAAARRGHVSTQIPRLSTVDPTTFSLSVATVRGDELTTGDPAPFSLQSITKLFALWGLLHKDHGSWKQVGWDHSDASYGSISDLEIHEGKPRNPFVNSGALIITDRLLTLTGDVPGTVIDLLTASGAGSARVDRHMAESEAATDHQNHAIAHILAKYHRLLNPVGEVLDQYFAQCAITASTLTVAKTALVLADRSPSNSSPPPNIARRINAVLLTAGMYGAADDMAQRLGLPAKSGIGGGVVAIMPRVGAICAWSPPLDARGNSAGAIAAIETFAHLAGWSIF